MKLLFGDLTDPSIYSLTSKIYFLRDSGSMFVIRIAAIFDLFTFSSYSATAVLFATVGFIGSWAFFLTFYRRYPDLCMPLAIVTFFVPSLVFWGSGLLKDTIILAALGIATHLIDRIVIQRKWSALSVVYLFLTLYIVFQIRRFVLQAFIPAALLWFFYQYLMTIRSLVLRAMIFPTILALVGYLGYLTVVKVGEGDKRYSLSNLASTAKITAYDIGFYTGRDAGSGYSLGELDGTFSNMMRKAPAAVNVTFFRPYLWEVRNPLMLLAALESFAFALFVIYIALAKRPELMRSLSNPDFIFLVTFSVTMAFAVGVTSYNFGTLSRYKTPILPFFLCAAVIIKSGKRGDISPVRQPLSTIVPKDYYPERESQS